MRPLSERLLLAFAAASLAACTKTSFEGGADGLSNPYFVSLDGLTVNGLCRPLCGSAISDADSDGWGWENQQSCLVEGSAPAVGESCSVTVPVSMLEEPEPPSSNNFDNGAIQAPAVAPPLFQPGRTAQRPPEARSTGFFVSAGRLYDALGNEFVMRGVNNPLAWFQGGAGGSAVAWLDDIANTGANSVRLVWERRSNGSPPPLALLRQGISRAIELGMIPIVELHDATGERDNQSMLALANYYVQPDVAAVLKEFEEHLLVNIANEWSGVDFANAYREAIGILRSGGINHTIVIDSNGWGQNANTILTEAPGLLASDPQHNVLFSLHMYEAFSDSPNQTWGTRVRTVLTRALADQIPLVVGEFGFQHGDDGSGNPRPVPYDVLLEQANLYGIGYLAWSWTGNGGGVEYLDLVDRQSGQLTDWGINMVEGPSESVKGIKETSALSSVFMR